MNNANNTYHPCLNEEELRTLAYHPGVHTNEHALRNHIATCEFCADALEGLQLISEQEYLSSIENINSRIEQQLSKDSRNESTEIPLKRWLAVAASFILLMGIAYLINLSLNKNEKQLSDTREPAEYKRPELNNADTKTEEDFSITKNEQSTNEPGFAPKDLSNEKTIRQTPHKDIEVKSAPAPPMYEMYVPQDAEYANAPTTVQGGVSKPDANKPVQLDDIVSYNSLAPVSADNMKSIPQKNILIKEETKSQKKDKVYRKENNMPTINDEKMQMPGNTSDGLFADSLNTISSEQLLNQAKFQYESSRYNDVLNICNTIIQRKDAVKDEASLWKAKCLIKLGKGSEAKKILKSLIDSNSGFKTEAQELLKTI